LEKYADRRKRHSAGVPLKKRVTEHGFHLLDLLTQDRLGDTKLRRRAAEVQSLRDSQKVAKIAHFEFSSSHMQNISEWRYRVLDGYGLKSYLLLRRTPMFLIRRNN
jgi:hypothetical protein